MNLVSVRWNDGYLETFDCTEVRGGSDLLFMVLADGQNCNIPLRQVRWWSTSDRSKAVQAPAVGDSKPCHASPKIEIEMKQADEGLEVRRPSPPRKASEADIMPMSFRNMTKKPGARKAVKK